MKVRDVMTTKIDTCRPGTNLAEVARLMWERDCGIIPVVDAEGKVLGTITDRDIAIAVGTREQLAKDIVVADVMPVSVVATATLDEDLGSALNRKRSSSVRRLPVIERSGMLRGIVSMSDIILRAPRKASGPSLDEIVNTFKGIFEHRQSVSAAH
jgi:CBS domain-containing protein